MSDSNKNKYSALETVIVFYYFLGLLAIIGGIVGILVAVSMKDENKVLIIIPSIIFGVFGAIFNFAQAEMLKLFIDIANNTEAIRVNTTMTSTIMNKGGKDLFEKALKTEDTTEKRILREEIAEKYPETEYGYFSKAYLVSLRGHDEEAVRLYTKAIEIEPDFAFAYCNRGDAYKEMKDYSNAIKDFTKAIELNPNDTFAYYNRGLAYAETDNFSQACSDWQKAYQLGHKPALELINKHCK